jgi:hypothetical protein
MSRITESYLGTGHDPRTFMVPSHLAEAVVRARREFVRRQMWENGGVKLLIN